GHWIVWPTSVSESRISAPHSQGAICASPSTVGGASPSSEPAATSKTAVSAVISMGSSSSKLTSSAGAFDGAFAGAFGAPTAGAGLHGGGSGSPNTGRIIVMDEWG